MSDEKTGARAELSVSVTVPLWPVLAAVAAVGGLAADLAGAWGVGWVFWWTALSFLLTGLLLAGTAAGRRRRNNL